MDIAPQIDYFVKKFTKLDVSVSMQDFWIKTRLERGLWFAKIPGLSEGFLRIDLIRATLKLGGT